MRRRVPTVTVRPGPVLVGALTRSAVIAGTATATATAKSVGGEKVGNQQKAAA